MLGDAGVYWQFASCRIGRQAAVERPRVRSSTMRIAPSARDIVLVPRGRYDGFLGTDLEIVLSGLGAYPRNTLIITGFVTNVCVLHTAVGAHQRDYSSGFPFESWLDWSAGIAGYSVSAVNFGPGNPCFSCLHAEVALGHWVTGKVQVEERWLNLCTISNRVTTCHIRRWDAETRLPEQKSARYRPDPIAPWPIRRSPSFSAFQHRQTASRRSSEDRVSTGSILRNTIHHFGGWTTLTAAFHSFSSISGLLRGIAASI
jgi:hypothetical protein